MEYQNTQLLKALVGSRAHGLHDPDSDTDWRGIHIAPTQQFWDVDAPKVKDSIWLEGETVDNTSYEVGHFFKLACGSNPNALEILTSPEFEIHTLDGNRILTLLHDFWSTQGVLAAYGGYSKNQEKKMHDAYEKEEPLKFRKFAVAYIRTLWNAERLLLFNQLTLKVPDGSFRLRLLEIRRGEWDKRRGELMDYAHGLRKRMEFAGELMVNTKTEKFTNFDRVNEVMRQLRETY